MHPQATNKLTQSRDDYRFGFEQNWLLTIIHSSYLGFAYLVWLRIAFLFLCDIVFNRGRITTEILSAIFDAIGSAFSVIPCERPLCAEAVIAVNT